MKPTHSLSAALRQTDVEAHASLHTLGKHALLLGALLGLGRVELLNAQTLEPVVVTANRALQRSFDAPAAIDAVDRESIESAGPQVNLSESLKRIPGLTLLNRQNYAQDLQLSIRGFGARSAFGVRGIRLIIDGIPATTPDGQGQGSSISLTSTDRIEVLRGPLAQLYGNSAGGVIQAFTREAPEQPEFSGQFYTGSYGLWRSDWQYAGRIANYGLVADYSTFDIDGYRANSHAERQQFNAKLRFEPNTQTQVNVVFNRFDMPLAEDPLGLTANQLAADPRQAGTNAISARVRKITLQNQLGTSLKYTIDADSAWTARLYGGGRDNLQYQANNTWVGLDRSYFGAGLQYNRQARLNGRPASLAAGLEIDYSKEGRRGGQAVAGEKAPGSLTRDESNVAQNQDLFLQGTAMAADSLSLTAGVRSSTVRFRSEDSFLTDGDGSGAVRYRAINPVLGMTFHARDDLNLYANFGKGFETPTLAEVAYTANTSPTPSTLFNPSLGASRSRHFELGAKWRPAESTRLDLTAFQVQSRDEIVVATSNAGRTAFKNAPGTTRSGVEASARFQLSAHWEASLAGSWINARFSDAYTNNSSLVASGNRLPGIPRHFVFSELLWSQNTKASEAREQRGTQAGLEFTSAGGMAVNDVNSAFSEGYRTLNARLSQTWRIGAFRLTAYGRIDNLTDKRYVGSVIVNQAAGQYFEPAPGRNWTLGLKAVLPL
ncbi:MAG: TonB-dependent receptor [Pseudomonadota bacterium]